MSDAVTITRLSVEHYQSPLGIGEPSPRLSWRMAGAVRDWEQQSYDVRIIGSTSDEEFNVTTSDSVLVPWPAAPLVSRQTAGVSVRSHGRDGSVTPWSSLRIEAGLLRRSDWKAQLITCDQQDEDKPKRPFRVITTFVPPKHLGQARLYITAHGVYEAYINGQRVGDEVLAPGWTDYRFNLNYRVHDVTDLLVPGQENTLGAWVGEGWYAGRLGFGQGARNIYGTRTALLAQLEVDGEVRVLTDESWKWSYGSTYSSEIYDGEGYSSREDDRWALTEDWRGVETVGFPLTLPSASQAPPVREIERFSAVEMIQTPFGKTIIDFGQNFAGYVQLLGEPPATTGELVLTHAEVLEHGELGIRPLRTAKCQDTILLGGQVRGWKPRFTFHGFRYVQIKGWPGITSADIVGISIATDMERTGHFKCSHRLLNRLHKNVVYSALSNCISLPTDCPQRDERMGWTGDVQLFAPTLNFLFDGSGFLGGWLRDLHAEQGEDDGVVPLVVPTIVPHKFLNTPKAAWGDAGVLVPDDVYRSFGDTRILEQQFEPMVLWLDRGVRRDIETGLWDTNEDQFGDHLAPKTEGSNGVTDSHLIADAYLIHVTRVAARTSGLLGRHVNTERFAHAASDLLKAFHSTYVTARSRVVSDTQAALAVILHFDLIDPDVSGQREVMVKRLEQLVTKCLWQVATGFVATPIILHVLSENDLLHHAYRMLQAKDSPSWLAPVLLGATTVWERWDSMLSDGTINTDEMTSFNRYALGSVADFLHTVVGGISPLSPGWKQILFRPRPGGSVTSAKVSHLSPYGFILCAWEIKGDKLHVTINIPPNCTGRVSLPWLDETVGSGRREYVVDFEPDPRFPPKVVRKIYEGSVSNDWVR